MIEDASWVVTFTREGEAGRRIGRFSSRDEAMLSAEAHFEKLMDDEDAELGWQMSFNGATALSELGIYRVARR